MVEEPVIVTYANPTERVLFNAARDANPFFHLYESLWMLAGRNDVAPLAYYNSRMPEFSDDGKTFNGAYGERWRSGLSYKPMMDRPITERYFDLEPVDQLKLLISHLHRKPESRRAVLQMWTVEDDLLRIDSSKDVCCNTACYFSLERTDTEGARQFLNMTVCNRSNDLIWGMLGANAVHFSVLQEYIAAHLGVGVGVYNQFTNNLHYYTERWEPEKWLAYDSNLDERLEYLPACTIVPLVEDPDTFDGELLAFVERHQRDALATLYQEPFLMTVAQPMCIAYHYYKRGDLDSALIVMGGVEADDWRVAGEQWLERRREKRVQARTSQR